MALTPSSGRELWHDLPAVSRSQRTAPLWAWTTSSPVGSATTASNGPPQPPRRSVFANLCTPRKVNSSSTVQAMTTRAAPAGFSRTRRAKAVSMAAMPPFTSQAPRP